MQTNPIAATAEAVAPLEIHDLTVSYHNKPVLWGIDLVVPPGKLIGIIGPNGAGKSTLIKAAMGLLPVNSGWVKVFGEPVKKNLTRVGYVPQRESVDWDFPVSVMDVVLMGRYGRLGLIKRPSKLDRDVALALIKTEGLDAAGLARARRAQCNPRGIPQRWFAALARSSGRAHGRQPDVTLL